MVERGAVHTMSKRLVGGLCALTGSVLLAATRATAKRRTKRRESAGDLAIRRYMNWFILPVWVASGVSDYLWHRRTHIETTSGEAESRMHLLMMAEAGPVVLAGLLLDINAGVLAIMIAGSAAHQLTAMWDVTFTSSRRMIPAGEQHTHSFLEMLPVAVTSAAICTHWEQFLALLGKGNEEARYGVRLRRPMPLKYVLGIGAVTLAFNILPHVEELLRCRRAAQLGEVGRDTPECVQELYG
jgi:hypothetical protein